jgi:hypothetical protein
MWATPKRLPAARARTPVAPLGKQVPEEPAGLAPSDAVSEQSRAGQFAARWPHPGGPRTCSAVGGGLGRIRRRRGGLDGFERNAQRACELAPAASTGLPTRTEARRSRTPARSKQRFGSARRRGPVAPPVRAPSPPAREPRDQVPPPRHLPACLAPIALRPPREPARMSATRSTRIARGVPTTQRQVRQNRCGRRISGLEHLTSSPEGTSVGRSSRSSRHCSRLPANRHPQLPSFPGR